MGRCGGGWCHLARVRIRSVADELGTGDVETDAKGCGLGGESAPEYGQVVR